MFSSPNGCDVRHSHGLASGYIVHFIWRVFHSFCCRRITAQWPLRSILVQTGIGKQEMKSMVHCERASASLRKARLGSYRSRLVSLATAT